MFKPVRGQLLRGRVNKERWARGGAPVPTLRSLRPPGAQISQTHIGLLVHGLFNASIDASALPETMAFDEGDETWWV